MPEERFTAVTANNLKIAVDAFEERDFNLINIIGNRIVTDFTFEKDEQDEDYVFIGPILKRLAGLLNKINEKKMIRDIEDNTEDFLDFLVDSFEDDDIDEDEIWDKYYQLEKDMRDLFISDSKKSEFEDRPEYSKNVRNYLVDYISKQRKRVLNLNINLMHGVMSELSRIYYTYGFEKDDLVMYILLTQFDRFLSYDKIDYAVMKKMGEDEMIDEKVERLHSYIDEIIDINDTEGVETIIRRSNKIIGELGIQWRLYIIDYGDIPISKAPPEKEGKKVIDLPDNVKEEISDIILNELKREAR